MTQNVWRQSITSGSIIDFVRDTFSLSDVEMYRVYGRNMNSHERLYSLRMLAIDWDSLGFKSMNDKIHEKIVNGLSVFELLTAKNLNSELILFAGSRLDLLHKDRQLLTDPFLARS